MEYRSDFRQFKCESFTKVSFTLILIRHFTNFLYFEAQTDLIFNPFLVITKIIYPPFHLNSKTVVDPLTARRLTRLLVLIDVADIAVLLINIVYSQPQASRERVNVIAN